METESPLNGVDGEGTFDCGICWEEYSYSKRGVLDSCDHKFCFECIQSVYKPMCPLCRVKFVGVLTPRDHSGIDSEHGLVVQPRCIECGQLYEDLLVTCSTCELQACAWCIGWYCNLCKMRAGNPVFNNLDAANQCDGIRGAAVGSGSAPLVLPVPPQWETHCNQSDNVQLVSLPKAPSPVTESHEDEGSSSTGAGEVYKRERDLVSHLSLDISGQISCRLLRGNPSPVSDSHEGGLLEPPFVKSLPGVSASSSKGAGLVYKGEREHVLTDPTMETESPLNGMDEERKFACVKCLESYPLYERGIKTSCDHECCFRCIREAGEKVFICPECGREVLNASKHSKDGEVEELWSAPPRCSICKNYREDDNEMLVNCSTCEDKFHLDCMEAVITCKSCGRLSHIWCEKWHCRVPECKSYVITVDGYQKLCG